MNHSCPRCHCEPCVCAVRGWAASLSPETHARGEMVRRHLPWALLLSSEGQARRDAEVDRLESLAPKHLSRDQLLRLYLLELVEALEREAPGDVPP